MGENKECIQGFVGKPERKRPLGNLRERDHLEDLGIGGRLILKYIFMTWDGQAWTGLSWLTVRTGVRLL